MEDMEAMVVMGVMEVMEEHHIHHQEFKSFLQLDQPWMECLDFSKEVEVGHGQDHSPVL